jgi:uncharacterized protein (TIGR02598 family)
MKSKTISQVGTGHRQTYHPPVLLVDTAILSYQNTNHMGCPVRRTAAFSLIEVTIALGIAALCLIVLFGLLAVGLKTQQAGVQQTTANDIMSMILGDLRADIRLPPGLVSKSQEGVSGFGLHGHWAAMAQPDTIYFTNQAKMTGGLNASTAPADAAFRAKVTYLFPPNASTSVATVTVTWPAPVDPSTTTPGGSVSTFIAVNR